MNRRLREDSLKCSESNESRPANKRSNINLNYTVYKGTQHFFGVFVKILSRSVKIQNFSVYKQKKGVYQRNIICEFPS